MVTPDVLRGPLMAPASYSAGTALWTCGSVRILAAIACQFAMPSRLARSWMLTWAVSPRKLRSSVLRIPLFTARAITSAMTPAATPITEMTVITEIMTCLRLARR